MKQLNELFDPERKDKNYTEKEYIPQVIEKTQDPVDIQDDTQEEIQETLNVSGDMYSLSTIEPISRNTTTTGLYGDTTIPYSDKESSSERDNAKTKRKVKKDKKCSSSESVR